MGLLDPLGDRGRDGRAAIEHPEAWRVLVRRDVDVGWDAPSAEERNAVLTDAEQNGKNAVGVRRSWRGGAPRHERRTNRRASSTQCIAYRTIASRASPAPWADVLDGEARASGDRGGDGCRDVLARAGGRRGGCAAGDGGRRRLQDMCVVGAMLRTPARWRSWMGGFAPIAADSPDVWATWIAAARRGGIADLALCARLAAKEREESNLSCALRRAGR